MTSWNRLARIPEVCEYVHMYECLCVCMRVCKRVGVSLTRILVVCVCVCIHACVSMYERLCARVQVLCIVWHVYL